MEASALLLPRGEARDRARLVTVDECRELLCMGSPFLAALLTPQLPAPTSSVRDHRKHDLQGLVLVVCLRALRRDAVVAIRRSCRTRRTCSPMTCIFSQLESERISCGRLLQVEKMKEMKSEGGSPGEQ